MGYTLLFTQKIPQQPDIVIVPDFESIHDAYFADHKQFTGTPDSTETSGSRYKHKYALGIYTNTKCKTYLKQTMV